MVSIRRRSRPGTTVQPPTISFSVVPSTIRKGSEGVMTWHVTDATTVSISPGLGVVPADGTRVVKPDTDTQYEIMATGPGGTQTGALIVLVRAAAARVTPPAIQFSVSPAAVFAGGTVHLSWHVRNAVAVSIGPDMGVVAPTGTFAERISAPKTYTLTATGPGGIETRQHLVTIRSP